MKETKQPKYYAIQDNDDGDTYQTGLNTRSEEDAADQFLELKIMGASSRDEREYKSLLKKVGPKAFIENFGCELLGQDEPFADGLDD